MRKGILWVLLMPFTAVALADEGAVLRLEVSGLRSSNGKIRCAVHSSERTFPRNADEAQARQAVEINGDTVVVEFKNLAAGTYAVSCFHDENANGSMDTNFLGIPKEGAAFSSGAKASMGPPQFDDAKFEYAGRQVVAMKMSY